MNEERMMGMRKKYDDRITVPCLLLCIIIFLIFGVLPLVPSSVTKILRPTFAVVSLFTLHRYYPWGNLKWQFALMAGYFFIFIINPVNRENVNSFIAYEMFSLFFLLGANTIWRKSEILLIFKTMVFSCTINAVITLISNSFFTQGSNNQHVNFLRMVMNRNSLAFGIAPGVICGLFLYIYSPHSGKYRFQRMMHLVSILTCSIALLMLACRSAFYSALIGAGCLIWGKVRQSHIPAERIIKRLILIMITVGGLSVVIRMTSSSGSARLFVVSGDNFDTGRNDLWEQARLLIRKKPIFGGGYDYWSSAGHQIGTHNTVLTLMLAGGVFLGSLFILMMVPIIMECAKTDLFLLMAFLIQSILHSLTESGMDYFAYVPLMLAVILQRSLKYQKNNLYRVFWD